MYAEYRRYKKEHFPQKKSKSSAWLESFSGNPLEKFGTEPRTKLFDRQSCIAWYELENEMAGWGGV